MFNYKYRLHGNAEYEIFIECPLCHKVTSIMVAFEDFRKWLTWEAPVEDCFPSLGSDEKKLFTTGLCLECQNDINTGDEP